MVPWTTPGKAVKEGGGSDGTSSSASRPRLAMLMERPHTGVEGIGRCAAVGRESKGPVLMLGVVG